MLEINGSKYELKYNIKRIEMIEAATGKPVLAEIRRTDGMLGIASLKAYFAYGLKEEGADTFVAPKKGMEMCEQLIEEENYAEVCGIILEALQRDCPFFFPAS